MSNRNVTNGWSKVLISVCLSFFVVSLLFAGGFSQLFAGEAFGKQLLTGKKIGNKEIEEKLALVKFNQEFIKGVQAKVAAYRTDELLKQKVKDYPAGEKIGAFLNAVATAESNGYDTREVLQSFVVQKKQLLEGLDLGSISGTVQVDAALSSSDFIDILAFDKFGFFAGIAPVDLSTGSYTVKDLLAGDYYLFARSSFADEFYSEKENLASDFSGSWQYAELVSIQNGGDVTGINFDLARGTESSGELNKYRIEGSFSAGDSNIEGTVTGPGGAEDLVSFAFVFAFDVTDTSIVGITISLFGGYSLDGLQAGTYKVYADSYLNLTIDLSGLQIQLQSLLGEYYDNAPTSDLATPVVLAEMQTLTGIDFTLESGGAISGNISDANGTALDSVFVIAVGLDVENINKFFTDSFDLGLTFSDANGNYTIPGLSTGDYYLRTISLLNANFEQLAEGEIFGKHAGQVLDEYYPMGQSIFDFDQAMPVAVTSPNTTPNIDFVLDLAGGISGSFVEASDGITPVNGDGIVIAFNATTGLPELALDFDSDSTSYEIRPLASGDFKLLGFVDSDEVVYLPQFFDLKDFDNADLVTVSAPNVTPDINFKMVRAGAIAGVVTLPNGNSVASVTSQPEITVLAFNASSGELAGGSDADSLSGEYTILGLVPGIYKVVALSATQGLAATYAGGGTSFGDPNSQTVQVQSDVTSSADIAVVAGEGIISGVVQNADGSIPLPGVLVIVYDQTGHAVSAGVSGFDLNTGQPLQNPDEYQVPGLAAGSYYVRTFPLFQILFALEDLGLDGDTGGDPLSVLLGLLNSSGDVFGSLGVELFADVWYPDEVDPVDLENLDLFSLVFGLILSEGDIQFVLPFFDLPPSVDQSTSLNTLDAQLVSVDSPGATPGIDFRLPKLEDVLTDVEETPQAEVVPESFQLSQNFPNPFNPGTKITYEVPEAARVKLFIYNLLGQRIRTLFDGVRAVGTYSAQWDGLNDGGEQVAAGIYFLRMETDNLTLTRKMLLVR
jgi:hypothetical protein